MNQFNDSQTDADPASSPDADAAAHALPEDHRIIEVVEEYLGQLEAGQSPDRSEFLNRYPELAAAVAQCLDGLELVHGGLGSRSGRRSSAGMLSSFKSDRLPNPLGDFQVVRELGRGGMGVVYEAIQLSLGRPVALKVLPFTAAFDSRQLQRFKNEAQAAALLHHTNIVPIYAVGCERGVHFYAMQLIEGVSLGEVISQLRKQEKPLAGGEKKGDSRDDNSQVLTSAYDYAPPEDSHVQNSTLNISTAMTVGTSTSGTTYIRKVSRLMYQAAIALEHAHQQGVIHRDVKPANLLVNAAGDLWVTDFGLAQFQADNGLTRTGDLLGTVRYMSPEQTSGQKILLDHRTDIYSLGATFYELVALEPVFSGESRQELIYQILHQEPRAPRTLNRGVPQELETIILKSISKNPADRYATAGDFAADIQRFLDNQPILARRPSLVDRVLKWSRRHPSIVAASVLTLAVIAIASLVSNWMIAQAQLRTEAARQREELRADEAEMRFHQARHAVDLLIEVSEDELADKPMVQGTRKRLLQTVLSYYQDFMEQRRGNLASQAELAAVQERVKGILYELDLLQRETQVFLLFNTATQTDLHLTAEQRTRLTDFFRQWSDDQAAVAAATTGQTDDDDRRRRFVAMAESHEKSLGEILTLEQRLRLRQIAIQTQGIFAFKDPAIAQSLNLTSEQIAGIRAIERGLFTRVPSFNKGEPSGGERHWRPTISREESVAKIIALLKPDQVKQWNDLIGPRFAGLDVHFFQNSFGGKSSVGPSRSRDGRGPDRGSSDRGTERGPEMRPPGSGSTPMLPSRGPRRTFENSQ